MNSGILRIILFLVTVFTRIQSIVTVYIRRRYGHKLKDHKMASESSLVLLDGGVGSELMDRLRKKEQRIDGAWSASALANPNTDVHELSENRRTLEEIHLEYLHAGSRIITANTYSCTPASAKVLGVDLKTLIEPNLRAAVDARRQFNRLTSSGVKIAYSLPPLRTSFVASAIPSDDVMADEYGRILQALSQVMLMPQAGETAVDIVIAETLQSTREVFGCLKAVSEWKAANCTEIWLAVPVCGNLNDVTLVSGEPLPDLLSMLFSEENLKYLPRALLFNCSVPEDIERALEVTTMFMKKLDGSASICLGAYPNGFRKAVRDLKQKAAERNGDKGVVNGSDDLWGAGNRKIEEDFGKRVAGWKRKWPDHVKILGGCCCVGPDCMKAIAEACASDGECFK